MKKCNGCGETRQNMFYKAEKSRCLSCLGKYNQSYYAKKKKKLMQERKQRQQDAVSCPDAVGSTFSSPEAVKRFCQARREVKCWREDVFCSCRDCSLQDRVDAGFIPANFRIMQLSLMARIN